MDKKIVIQKAFVLVAVVAYVISPIASYIYCGHVIMHTEHAGRFVHVYKMSLQMLDAI